MAAPSTIPAWKETWLWKTLEERKGESGNVHAESVSRTVHDWMEKMVPVLSASGTSPNDFTLHDAEHSLRVAERIAGLIPEEVQLSDYELGLLLLAAYGHDIGMTPQRGKVRDHYGHLFGNKTGLTDSEKNEFQRFLDEYSTGPVTTPLTTSQADLDLAEEVTAYYVRDRHNDWSAEWIRENLDAKDFGSLPDPVGKLVLLCCSHHFGFDALRGAAFEPIPSGGSQPQIIHLRYLACLLRLADILENDPARTPAVLFEHRDIASREKSLIHWKLPSCFVIQMGERQLNIHSRPTDAHLHKAVLDLTAAINHELNGICSLGHLMPVEFLLGKEKIRREWHLAPALSEDIQSDRSYEYIDGAFRPNTARLLELLSNEQLYGNPFAAVRELLQNAFDAVREKIARQQLLAHEKENPIADWEKALGNLQHVTLTLRPGATGGWELVCEDSGVGMNTGIIKNHVLVSGNSRRHSIMELERRCEQKGFRLGRTGQFGIGVLSYFMLAEEVSIETTRSQQCGDIQESLLFRTRGVGSFGELRKATSAVFPDGGTRIVWKIRPECIEGPEKFSQSLLTYLKETIIRIPCSFIYRTENLASESTEWKRPAGWVKTEQDWRNIISSRWQTAEEKNLKNLSQYASEKTITEICATRQKAERELEEAEAALRIEFVEVPLPKGAGIARLVIPYYELAHGRCLVPRPDEIKFPSFYGYPDENPASWQGMKCNINQNVLEVSNTPCPAGLRCELDMTAVGPASVGVSRQGASVAVETLGSWKTKMEEAGWAVADDLLAAGNGNYYHEMNLAVLERPITMKEGCGWYLGGKSQNFRAIERPLCLSVSSFGFDRPFWRSFETATGDLVSLTHGGTRNARIVGGFELRVQNNASKKPHSEVFLFWPKNGVARSIDNIEFPKEWRDVAFIHVRDRSGHIMEQDRSIMLVNSQNPLIALLPERMIIGLHVWDYTEESVWQFLDNADTAEQAIRAFCRLARKALIKEPEEWALYSTKRGQHLDLLWKMIEEKSGINRAKLAFIGSSGEDVVILSPNRYRFPGTFAPAESLPAVTDPDFLLYEVNPKSGERL